MELKDVKIDMYVQIANPCEYTRKAFGWNDDMDIFQGTIRQVKSFTVNRDGVRFHNVSHIRDFNWSIKDISPAQMPVKKSKIINFNIKNLDL